MECARRVAIEVKLFHNGERNKNFFNWPRSVIIFVEPNNWLFLQHSGRRSDRKAKSFDWIVMYDSIDRMIPTWVSNTWGAMSKGRLLYFGWVPRCRMRAREGGWSQGIHAALTGFGVPRRICYNWQPLRWRANCRKKWIKWIERMRGTDQVDLSFIN